MHPKVSNAEEQVFADLSSDGLTEGLITQFKIDLTTVVPESAMSYAARDSGKFEFLIDFAWPSRLKALHVDGDAIHKGRRLDLDEAIDLALTRLGWDVKRIRYRAPLSRKRRLEIRKELNEWLKNGTEKTG